MLDKDYLPALPVEKEKTPYEKVRAMVDPWLFKIGILSFRKVITGGVYHNNKMYYSDLKDIFFSLILLLILLKYSFGEFSSIGEKISTITVL